MLLQHLHTVIPDLKNAQQLILSRWMQKFCVVTFLHEYDIKPEYFINHFAVRIISNGLAMVEDSLEESDFYVTKELLDEFRDKEINPYDIFRIYKAMKEVCVELISEGDILSAEFLFNRDKIIIDFYRFFEGLTEGVLFYYAQEYYHNEGAINAELFKPLERQKVL